MGTITRITWAADNHSWGATVSGTGRYVAFSSTADNLLPGDDNGAEDVYVWDRTGHSMTRITDGNGASFGPSISDDGRYVVFESTATDLVPGDVNNNIDVFRWDRTTGSIIRLTAGDDLSGQANISGDGQHVVFVSYASNLLPGDTNGHADVFIWRAADGSIVRVSDSPHASLVPSISGNGQVVTYHGFTSNFVPGDTNDRWDIFVWSAASGTTRRITDGDEDSINSAVSADGGHVVFWSWATNLVPDTDGAGLFLWDAATGTIRRVVPGGYDSATISADGRYVAYRAAGVSFQDVFLWDAASGKATKLTDGQGNSSRPSISGDGRTIAFSSEAFNLVPDDDNGASDVFVWDRTD